MPWLNIDAIHHYSQTGGYEYDFVGSGWLTFNVDPALTIPYLWWTPDRTLHPSVSMTEWWQGLDPSDLEKMDFLKFKPESYPDRFYYLVIPKVDDSPFATLEVGKQIKIRNYNPAAKPLETFEKLFDPHYQFTDNDVQGERLGIEEMIDFVRNLEKPSESKPCESTALNIEINCHEEVDPVQPVPEYSSGLTLLIFGLALCTRFFKRKRI